MPEPVDLDRLGYSDGLPQGNVQAMVQDQLGFMWLGTQDGLARYDGSRMRVYRPLDNDPTSISSGFVTSLVLDASGKLWVGTDNKGVNVYDPSTDKFTRYMHSAAAGSLSSEGVNAILRDRKDRVWFAMTGGGLNRFDPAKGTFIEHTTAPLDNINVTSLDDDEAGNLWLGTAESGLLRWNPDDGKLTKYTTEGLAGAPIRAVVVATKGAVWVGSEREGLYTIEPKTGAIVRHRHDPADPESITADHITAMFEDRNGGIWIGTNNGLNRTDGSSRFVRYNHDPNNPTSLIYPWLSSIYQDRGGVIWVGAAARGLSKFSPARHAFGHHRTRTDTANSFLEDADGTLWVGTYHGGLYKYERKARRVTTYYTLGAPDAEGSIRLKSAWISDLHRDRKGMLWIATREAGLISFDTKTETYRQFRANPEDAASLPNDEIWDIWEDANGALWLATWGGGLVRYDLKTGTVSDFTVEDDVGLTSNHLYRLYPDPKESKILWIGTAKGGLVRFDTSAGTATSFRHKDEDLASLSSDDVLTMHREASGAIWVGTYGGGLNRLDPATGKAQRFTSNTSNLTSDVVLGILADDDGKLWLSTNGGGLLQLDPASGKFLAFDSSDGVQDTEFGQGSFMRARSGELFFGGVGGFNAFFPRSIKLDSYVPPIALTGFKLFNEEVKLESPIWTAPPIEVSYADSFEIQFAALDYAAPKKSRFAYKLEGFDDDFVETDRPFATYTKLAGGNYVLRVRASNQHGVWNEQGIALDLSVEPPFWRTWPAFCVYLALIVIAIALFYRWQRGRVRQAEREGRLAVVERDLALTGAVQSGFLPEYNETRSDNVHIYGFYRAADTCSGDWWWHESMGDGRQIVLVGDVTGHGPGPAMVTAAVATAFRVLVGNGLNDIRVALDVLNQVVLHVAKGKYHMTMAALELDERTGQWVLHNAGAPPILTLDHNGKHKVHFSAGCPLGTDAAFETGRIEGRLGPNERILIYTDGITEIALPNGSVLGIRRFGQLYERTRTQELKDAAASIVHEADLVQSNEPQMDDWTFTMIEWSATS